MAVVLAGVTAAVSLQAFAIALRRQGHELGLAFYWVAALMLIVSVGWAVLQDGLTVRTRQWLSVAFLVVSGLMYRMTDPLLVTGFDEQLHARALQDVIASHHLLSANPMLEVSPYFPGLEVLAASLHDLTGIPAIAAATVVVLLSRSLLGLAIFEGARAVGCDPRIASLAVLLYGASPQFYFFNSQFAYQTLAVALGVAALVLIRTAQTATDPRVRRARLACGVIAMAACGVTHHISSWLTCAFAVAWWLVTPRRAGRSTVRNGALAGLVVVALWDSAIFQGLYDYLAPVAAEAGLQLSALARGQSQRHYFQDSGGVVAPTWQRYTLLAYAGLASLAALGAGLWAGRRALRNRSATWGLLAALCLAYPLTLASRVAPATAELGERTSTFIFLPWALLVALAAGALETRLRLRWATGRVVAAGLAVLSLVFVGGNLLGSGPDWERLPGGWLASAENRSLDPETLAAVDWARDHLASGSRIVADRMPSTVLAADAQLWPVTEPNSRLDVASLYFADNWGPPQRQVVKQGRIRYLYVDERLSTQLPHVGAYFNDGESPGVRQLTAAQLTKFATLPEMTAVYRHGPVRIYEIDTTALGFAPERTGQLARSAAGATWRGALVGLLVGLVLLAGRLRYGARMALRWAGRPRVQGSGLAVLTVCLSVPVLVGTGSYALGVAPSWTFTLGLLAPHVRWLASRLPALPRPHASTRLVWYCAICAGTSLIWLVNTYVSAHDADVVQVNAILAEVTRDGG